MNTAGPGNGENGPFRASGPVGAGHVAEDDTNTHLGSTRQGISADETFSRKVDEAARNLRENFEVEASDNAIKVRRSLILFC